MCPASKKNTSNSIKGRLWRFDLIQTWKAIHSDFDVGHSNTFEYARKTGTRGHAHTLPVPCIGKMWKIGVMQ